MNEEVKITQLPIVGHPGPELPAALTQAFNRRESDPFGKALNTTGAKADAGKIRPSLVLGGFARALTEVCKVGTYGAVKYTDNGWMEVPNGIERYDDAKMRHWLDEKRGTPTDKDTDLIHAAHEAWNALARLDLMLREAETASAAAAAADMKGVHGS